MRQIVWTRSRQDWPKDEQLLVASGKPFLHLPCIKTKPKTFAVPSADSFDVAVFTSAKAVKAAFAKKKLLQSFGQKPVYSFGVATCRALADLGLQVNRIEVNSAEALCSYLAKHLEPDQRVLVVQAVRPAFDMVEELELCSRRAVGLAVYETVPDLKLDADKVTYYEKNLDGVICFASPTAVETFVNKLDPQKVALNGNCEVAVIGKTTAAEAQKFFGRVSVCNSPSIMGLIDLAVDILG